MNIIDEQKSYINKIVTMQKYDSTKSYIKSQYVIIYNYNDKYLVYNNLFCSLYEFDSKEYNALMHPETADTKTLEMLVFDEKGV